MDWRIIERDRQYVVDKLRTGVFEALEVVTCVAETEFFYYLLRQGDLAKLAASYPSARKREDVPLWVYLSSELSMRINAHHGFRAVPYVLPCSGLRKKRGLAAREDTAAKRKPRLLKTAIKAVKDLRIWDACEVPIHVAVMRDLYEDGRESRWVLATTMDLDEPIELRQYYQLRPTIEERIRQTKCFWDLAKFRSTKFSLIVNQIVFVLMAYTLVQIFLLKTGRKDLAAHTRERLFEELISQDDRMALYCDGRVAFLPPLDYQEIILSLEEHARRKILGLTRKLQAQRSAPPEKPWRP